MPSIQSAIISARITCTALNPLNVVTAQSPLDLNSILTLANGTGAGKANQIWSDKRTLAASASENLDLSGVLLDAFGNAIAFTKLKGLLVIADPGNTNNVIVGAAATNPWSGLLNPTGTATLTPGAGLMAWASDAVAFTVTAGTGDLLKIANSGAGTSVIYRIVALGEG